MMCKYTWVFSVSFIHIFPGVSDLVDFSGQNPCDLSQNLICSNASLKGYQGSHLHSHSPVRRWTLQVFDREDPARFKSRRIQLETRRWLTFWDTIKICFIVFFLMPLMGIQQQKKQDCTPNISRRSCFTNRYNFFHNKSSCSMVIYATSMMLAIGAIRSIWKLLGGWNNLQRPHPSQWPVVSRAPRWHQVGCLTGEQTKFAEVLPISNPAIPHVRIFFSVYTPPKTKMTGWKIPMFNKEIRLHSWWIFRPVTFFLGVHYASLGTRTRFFDHRHHCSCIISLAKRGSIGDEIPL